MRPRTNSAWTFVFVTDRCHQLYDPWAIAPLRCMLNRPMRRRTRVLTAVRGGEQIDGLLAFGDRPAVAAATLLEG